MALSMASMAGLRGSSPAALQSNRRGRTAVARTGFSVRASSAETETETSRRAMLGLVATGIVSGSFVQAVLAEPPKNEPFGALVKDGETNQKVKRVDGGVDSRRTTVVIEGARRRSGVCEEAASAGITTGGWTKIENPQAPEVVKIAEFAVKEHNKEAGTSLVLESVADGYTQVVAGINYRLIISAKGIPGYYSTLLYAGLPPKSPELISFDRLLG